MAFLDASGHLVFEPDVLGLADRKRRFFAVGAEPVAVGLHDAHGELLLGIGQVGHCALGVGLGALDTGFDAPASPKRLVQGQDGDCFITRVAEIFAVRGGVLHRDGRRGEVLPTGRGNAFLGGLHQGLLGLDGGVGGGGYRQQSWQLQKRTVLGTDVSRIKQGNCPQAID